MWCGLLDCYFGGICDFVLVSCFSGISGTNDDPVENSDETKLAVPESGSQDSQIKVVHVVHHIQPGVPMPTAQDFTDIAGQVTEIKEESLPSGEINDEDGIKN